MNNSSSISKYNRIITIRYKQIVLWIGLISWSLMIGCHYFQVPFKNISAFIAPSAFIFLLTKIKRFRFRERLVYPFIFCIYFIYASFSLIYGLISGNPFAIGMRFFLILLAIIFYSSIFEGSFEKEYKIFKFLSVCKVFYLFSIFIIVLITGNILHWREWARSNVFGDVYYNQTFLIKIPMVQLKGNALLVVAFMVDYIRNKRFTKYNVLILFGVLIAGNFAYIAALVLFFGILMILFLNKGNYMTFKKLAIIILLIVGMILALIYTYSQFEIKGQYSNLVRNEQASLLLNANPFIGEGLGNVLEIKTKFRDYTGDISFELMTLYIFNQIGIIGLALFYYLTLFPVMKRGNQCIFIYSIYLFFTFWNPYCFDTTQMMALMVILNCSGTENRIIRYVKNKVHGGEYNV